MKIITYIYIFALYVLFIPGFLIKRKFAIDANILNSLLFSLILYFTFHVIEQNRENYNEYNVDVKGVDSLVNLMKTQFGTSGGNKQIDINNQVGGSQGNSNMNCWNALGKNQKEIEIIKVQLDSFAGTKGDIDTLNNQLETLKQEIASLENKLVGSKGSNKKVDELNIQIKNNQDQIAELQEKIKVYNETDGNIKDINNQISQIQSEITDLNLKISTCGDTNNGHNGTIQTLNDKITEQNTTISNLNKDQTDKVRVLRTQLNNQKQRINDYHDAIKDKYNKFKCNGELPTLKTWKDFLN